LNLLKAKPFPELRTKRLLLRCASARDANDYHRILSCPETSYYSDVPHNPTKKRTERFVSWMSKLHPRGTGVGWIMQLHQSNSAIGAIRINRIEKKASCGIIGYELHPDFWNAGFATESLNALVVHAHKTMCLNRLEAWTTEGNIASEKVLLNNGFQYEGTQRSKVWFRDRACSHVWQKTSCTHSSIVRQIRFLSTWRDSYAKQCEPGYQASDQHLRISLYFLTMTVKDLPILQHADKSGLHRDADTEDAASAYLKDTAKQRQAAVLMPLVKTAGQWHLLFIRRAGRLPGWRYRERRRICHSHCAA